MTSGVGRYKGERGLFEVGDLITPDSCHRQQDPVVHYNVRRPTSGYYASYPRPIVYTDVNSVFLVLDKRIEHSPSMWYIVYFVLGIDEIQNDVGFLSFRAIRGWTSGCGYRNVNEAEAIDPFERKPGYVDRILVMLSQS